MRASLAEIIDDANRYAKYPIEVDISARDLRLSGTFHANDIDGLLSTLSIALPIEIVTRNDTQLIVKAE